MWPIDQPCIELGICNSEPIGQSEQHGKICQFSTLDSGRGNKCRAGKFGKYIP